MYFLVFLASHLNPSQQLSLYSLCQGRGLPAQKQQVVLIVILDLGTQAQREKWNQYLKVVWPIP